MNDKKQATHQSSYAGGATFKRVLAALAFLAGALAAELARPCNCNLIHRAAARQPAYRPRKPS